MGLNFLHVTCGIVHTDVKPENILVDHMDVHNNRVCEEKISDLGSSVRSKVICSQDVSEVVMTKV